MRLVSPAILRAKGILGMNARNISYIGRYNERRRYPLVDNKLRTKQAAIQQGIPVPDLLTVVSSQHEVDGVEQRLSAHNGFVIKPAQGSGGKGILVITNHRDGVYTKASGAEIDGREIRRHCSNILSGLHSLGGRNDHAMVEALIDFDPVLANYSYEGVPDIRVIVFQGVPVMAMLRCATHSSDGKANLHQGAVGVGLDIASGDAMHAVQWGKLINAHPDTAMSFSQLNVPHWQHILEMAAHCAEMTGLGYLGADIVLDRAQGPMLLELNARPGLAIQIANQEGLQNRLTRAAEIARECDNIAQKIARAKSQFGRS